MTLPSSGPIDMAMIHAEFGRGYDLNSYRGTLWYTDGGASGYFSSGAIYMNEFYGKRLTSPIGPVVPGSQIFTAPGTFVVPNYNILTARLDAAWGSDTVALIYCGGGFYTGGRGGLAIKTWGVGIPVGSSISVLTGAFVNSSANGVTALRGGDANPGAGFGGGGCCGGGLCTLTPSNGVDAGASGGDTNITGGSAYQFSQVRFDWS